jgi:hypothetical protein
MRVYIVPYRDRKEHLEFFKTYLPHVDPGTDYRVLVVHQCDQRPFNRGAMKNIGFLAVKQLYPDTYKDVTLIFNDVDIMPYKEGVFHTDTGGGVVRHNYGYTSCLSASFVIKGRDFEACGGFPNFWTWGLEDFFIQERVLRVGLKIDRSRFHPVGHKAVLQFFDGITRPVSTLNVDALRRKHERDGWDSVQCRFDVEGDFVQVWSFTCPFGPDDAPVVHRDIRTMGVNMFPRR